jgi:hypothetical protein
MDYKNRYGPDLCKGPGTDFKIPYNDTNIDLFKAYTECNAFKVGATCLRTMLCYEELTAQERKDAEKALKGTQQRVDYWCDKFKELNK